MKSSFERRLQKVEAAMNPAPGKMLLEDILAGTWDDRPASETKPRAPSSALDGLAGDWDTAPASVRELPTNPYTLKEEI